MTEFESKLIYLIKEIAITLVADSEDANGWRDDYDCSLRNTRYRMNREINNVDWEGKDNEAKKD